MSDPLPAVVLASEACGTRGGTALAAALCVEASIAGGAASVLAELSAEPRRRPPTLLAAAAARRVEASLDAAGLSSSARGHLCHLGLPADHESLPLLVRVAAEVPGVSLLAIALPPELWVTALSLPELPVRAGLLRVELPRDRSLAALAVAELRSRGARAKVVTRPLPRLAERRALAGLSPGGESARKVRRIANWLLADRRRRPSSREAGQALPALLGCAAVVLISALLLSAIGGAVIGKGRVQRAADLAALSGARSMRDDLPRLLAPSRLPDGSPNPRHLPRGEYFQRAVAAARGAARQNGVDPGRLLTRFPDAREPVPLRIRAAVRAEIDPAAIPGGRRLAEERARQVAPIPVTAFAVAEAAPPAGSWSGMPATGSGGGYSGPLAYRNGEGMRPDVALAFDRMAAAARRAGHGLVVSSGFRSDAEQAELFAAHPDPRWVAPPGRSLHRCATELDLGPASAYGWLAANARRFGFLRRYSWEPWHYGYVAGPPPCSPVGNAVGSGPDGAAGAQALPSFVPVPYRAPILRSAGRWNVSAALLAAQLEAESGFDPRAVSPAGALGIAQFMPSTAAAYGLRDPFDPEAAIDAQAHLMSDLLRQFGSVPLALAAYNAGPGAVAACGCVPPYPETRAYVARILALLDGAGALLVPPLQVRLVR